jgi:predicted esterase
METVVLADGSEASVTLPLGATEARPVVLGVHGAGDRPEWSCGEWRMVFDSYAFVVCPHGAPRGGAFVWQSSDQLEKRAIAALVAVREKYAGYVLDGPVVYAGFSQGSYLAPYVIRRHPDVFSMMAIDEGGYEQTGGDFPNAYFHGGGRRALLMCSTPSCETGFASSRTLLERAGIDARVKKLGPFGHTVNDAVIAAIKEQWKWLVRDDARWATWVSSSSSP